MRGGVASATADGVVGGACFDAAAQRAVFLLLCAGYLRSLELTVGAPARLDGSSIQPSSSRLPVSGGSAAYRVMRYNAGSRPWKAAGVGGGGRRRAVAAGEEGGALPAAFYMPHAALEEKWAYAFASNACIGFVCCYRHALNCFRYGYGSPHLCTTAHIATCPTATTLLRCGSAYYLDLRCSALATCGNVAAAGFAVSVKIPAGFLPQFREHF
jgi:hypothetical protein